MVTPAARRQAAGFLQADFEVSERRACSVDEIDSAANEQDVLLSRLTRAYDIELVMDVLDRAEE